MEEPHNPAQDGKDHWAEFSPLLSESSYRTRDLAGLLTGVEVLDLSRLFLSLKPIPESYLMSLEMSTDVELSLASRERRASVAAIERTNFCNVPFRVDNVIIATSLSLWSTTLRSNEIIRATRNRFLTCMESKRREKKNKLPLRPFFKFLNEMGIDVVVMSSCKEKVAVLHAKRWSKRQPSAVEVVASSSVRKRRILVALEFSINDGLWSPMQLPVMLLHRHVGPDASRDALKDTSVLTGWNQIKLVDVSTDIAENSHTFNANATMLNRTVYNPQMVCIEKEGCTQAPGEHKHEEVIPQDSPFWGMRYPNINQMDLQMTEVLRRGLHPVLYRNRIRFLVSIPVALASFVLGFVLIMYVKNNLQACFYSVSLGDCVSDTYSSLETSGNDSICNDVNKMVLLQAVEVFLFGNAGSPGRFVVATVCCMFVALLLAVSVNYLTTRMVARHGSRPLFFMVVVTAHVLLAAAACVFSAYALYILSHETHVVQCSSFDKKNAASCTVAQELCPKFVIEVRAYHSLHVTLALSILLVILCSVELLASLLPPMPSKETENTLVRANPETYVFHPSVYAPDGISHADKILLMQQIEKRLHMHLQDQMHHDVLPKRSATIGEMMLANREKSLLGRSFQGSSKDASLSQSKNAEQNIIHYVAFQDNDGAVNEGCSARPEEVTKLNQRKLPSKLLEEVVRICNRLQASASVREAERELQQSNVHV